MGIPGQRQTSRGPHLWAYVGLAIDDLRGGVERASAKSLQELARVEEVGETKISDLQDGINGEGSCQSSLILQSLLGPPWALEGSKAT